MLPGEYEIHIHSTLSLKAKAGSTNFQQITNDELGKPAIKLTGNFQARAKDLGCKYLHVSLSHTKEYGLAQVILEGDKI